MNVTIFNQKLKRPISIITVRKVRGNNMLFNFIHIIILLTKRVKLQMVSHLPYYNTKDKHTSFNFHNLTSQSSVERNDRRLSPNMFHFITFISLLVFQFYLRPRNRTWIKINIKMGQFFNLFLDKIWNRKAHNSVDQEAKWSNTYLFFELFIFLYQRMCIF